MYFRLCYSPNISSVRECTCLIVFDRPSLGFFFFHCNKRVWTCTHRFLVLFLVYELGFYIDTKPVPSQKMVSNIFPTVPPPDHGLAMYVTFIFFNVVCCMCIYIWSVNRIDSAAKKILFMMICVNNSFRLP